MVLRSFAKRWRSSTVASEECSVRTKCLVGVERIGSVVEEKFEFQTVNLTPIGGKSSLLHIISLLPRKPALNYILWS